MSDVVALHFAVKAFFAYEDGDSRVKTAGFQQ